MKYLLLLLSLAIASLQLHAQTWNSILTLGASQYVGDIPDRSVGALARGLVGAGLEYHPTGAFRLKFEGVVTQLKASDAGTSNAARNLSFTTWLSEGSVTGRVDLVRNRNARVIPYLSAGVAAFYVNPWATGPNGNRLSLYRLSTEGQGLSANQEELSKYNLSLPFGGGLDFSLGKRIRVDLEWILRKTFTDHIDDVGGNYPDRQALLNARGSEAVAMSWRGSGPFPRAGTARGNIADKDWYAAVQLRFRLVNLQGKQIKKLKDKLLNPSSPQATTPAASTPSAPAPVATQKPAVTSPSKPAAPSPVPAPAPVPVAKPDKDGDGIPDDIDNCPEVAGIKARNGCPTRDFDQDGLNDEEDACPLQAGTRENKGCPPVDRDNDGIPNSQDRCPDVPGIARYFGCPIPDTDKDGVNDEEDKCPDKAGAPSLKGCPLPDKDGDGIEDLLDRCITVPGIDSLSGCPTVPIRTSRITFQGSGVELTATAKQELESLAIWLVKVYPQLLVMIESHVDVSKGSYAAKQLSESRAMAVYIHLFRSGVPIARMQAVGLGADHPIDNTLTPQGMARNNRLEFRFSE